MPAEFDKQPSFNFDSIGYRPEDHFYPHSVSRIFLSPETKSRSKKLLAYMRGLAERAFNGEIEREESYKTKAQLAEMLYPKFYDPKHKKLDDPKIYDFYNLYSVRKLLEERHKKKITQAISSIDNRIIKKLDEFDNEKQKLSFLKNKAELLIRVADTTEGEVIYGYYSADIPQPIEILEAYREWAMEHIDKQSRPSRLANLLHRSATNPEQLKLNLGLDFDDEGFDEIEDNL